MEGEIILITPSKLKSLVIEAVSIALKYHQPLIVQQASESINRSDLLTIKQAAKVVNLAVPTIYGLVGRNEIPFMKRDGAKRLYFSRRELEDWIRHGRRKTVEECANEARNDLKLRGP